MSKPAIKIEGLGKRYIVDHERKGKGGGYRTLRESIADACGAPWRRIRGLGARGSGLGRGGEGERPTKEEFWALRDVSFEVQPGEVVGIIGRNGAGKSTLLKILSQITKPTTGRVELNGRVGSLLEVGTGFHPELTGRENIYLNGSILGMRKTEIDRKFDEIVEFAEIEQFLDTPVKRYSSGMYVRLAFAVAAHLEPEILIIDEVLAVGDAAFQNKCVGKIRDVADSGRTILFVSHQMPTVLKLCTRAIELNNGSVAANGETSEVVSVYMTRGCRESEPVLSLGRKHRSSHLHRRATLVQCAMEGRSTWAVSFGDDVLLSLTIDVARPLDCLDFGFGLFTMSGFEIASAMSADSLAQQGVNPGRYQCSISIRDLGLAPGTYYFNLGVRSGMGMEDYVEQAVFFDVIPTRESAAMNVQARYCAVIPRTVAHIEKVDICESPDNYLAYINS